MLGSLVRTHTPAGGSHPEELEKGRHVPTWPQGRWTWVQAGSRGSGSEGFGVSPVLPCIRVSPLLCTAAPAGPLPSCLAFPPCPCLFSTCGLCLLRTLLFLTSPARSGPAAQNPTPCSLSASLALLLRCAGRSHVPCSRPLRGRL